MKLSVFTVASPDLTPEELCEAAAAAGIKGMEWRCKETPADKLNEKPSFWGNNLATISPDASEEDIVRFEQAAAKHERQTISITPYLTCGDIEATENIFRLAKRFGASMIRVGVPGYDRTRNYNELFDLAAAYLREVEPLARDYGVKAVVETHHNTIVPSAALTHRLVSSFNPDQIGVLYDPGNMVYEGYENYRMGLELLGPYLAHVHVKNAGWMPAPGHPNAAQASGKGGSEGDALDPIAWSCGWRPIASGIVPWKQVLSDLRAVGYDGWFGVEDFSSAYDTRTMLKIYANQMNRWMEEIG
ncbi:sugar phosphate isomerase/epimerase [Paenibacillus sp. sptzw28]|uniref:sugar phosphate isomerase/epimerase family protein n=1 Tax=Paenibacillus sp. sptzw28 TaxID=715179 RepID=UPI001C6E3B65|nr:sugar phosphate isomerase/epimerase [Paenibacillus sp. sptzw28]QYR24298.1 sugar phosphate isomerase/epimerase [Paenibacillus sp. sptzw28]